MTICFKFFIAAYLTAFFTLKDANIFSALVRVLFFLNGNGDAFFRNAGAYQTARCHILEDTNLYNGFKNSHCKVSINFTLLCKNGI
jgi:hypothetical protein